MSELTQVVVVDEHGERHIRNLGDLVQDFSSLISSTPGNILVISVVDGKMAAFPKTTQSDRRGENIDLTAIILTQADFALIRERVEAIANRQNEIVNKLQPTAITSAINPLPPVDTDYTTP